MGVRVPLPPLHDGVQARRSPGCSQAASPNWHCAHCTQARVLFYLLLCYPRPHDMTLHYMRRPC